MKNHHVVPMSCKRHDFEFGIIQGRTNLKSRIRHSGNSRDIKPFTFPHRVGDCIQRIIFGKSMFASTSQKADCHPLIVLTNSDLFMCRMVKRVFMLVAMERQRAVGNIVRESVS